MINTHNIKFTKFTVLKFTIQHGVPHFLFLERSYQSHSFFEEEGNQRIRMDPESASFSQASKYSSSLLVITNRLLYHTSVPVIRDYPVTSSLPEYSYRFAKF